MVKKLPGWALPDLREAQKRTKNEVEFQTAQFSIPYEILNLGRGKKYYLRTYGCQANERDSETIAGIMEELGYETTTDVEQADVILLNTCAVRKNAEDKVIGEIGALKRLTKDRPDLILGVCGCMSQEEEIVNLLLEKHRHVNLIFGTHNIHRLPELLYKVHHGTKTVEVFSKEGEVIENLPVRRFGKHKAWVNIMYGCEVVKRIRSIPVFALSSIKVAKPLSIPKSLPYAFTFCPRSVTSLNPSSFNCLISAIMSSK